MTSIEVYMKIEVWIPENRVSIPPREQDMYAYDVEWLRFKQLDKIRGFELCLRMNDMPNAGRKTEHQFKFETFNAEYRENVLVFTIHDVFLNWCYELNTFLMENEDNE